MKIGICFSPHQNQSKEVLQVSFQKTFIHTPQIGRCWCSRTTLVLIAEEQSALTCDVPHVHVVQRIEAQYDEMAIPSYGAPLLD